MWIAFTLRHGPQWQESLDAIDSDLERFSEHIRAMEFALKRDPIGWTEGFLAHGPGLRVFRTQDLANHYEIVVFLKVDTEAHACDLKWVEMRTLAGDNEPDPGPKGLR